MTLRDQYRQVPNSSQQPKDVFLMVAMSHICLAIPVSHLVLSSHDKKIILTLTSSDLASPPTQWDEVLSCTLPYKIQYNGSDENKEPYLYTVELIDKEVFDDKIILHMIKKRTHL